MEITLVVAMLVQSFPSTSHPDFASSPSQCLRSARGGLFMTLRSVGTA